MPFGVKPDASGRRPIDFDRLYEAAIAPGIRAAGLSPIRADAEVAGGIIHKPMFERLILCEYAVADLTTANANVFYELGVRHAVRPSTTLTMFARHQPLPFDVNFLRSLPYELADDNSLDDARAATIAQALTKRIGELRNQARTAAASDSPLFQLLGEFTPGKLAREKTDVFHQEVAYSEDLKRRLADARVRRDPALVAAIRADVGALDDLEAGVVIDLFLTYRALKDWDGMVALYDAMPEVLKRSILVREQLAFALNRRAGKVIDSPDRRRAIELLADVEKQQGPSSETSGLVGRIYKDLWELSRAADPLAARGYLKKALEAYRRGFDADTRDAYPGINAVTLLELEGSATSLKARDELVPLVRYAVRRRLQVGVPDYWDHATLLELAVIGRDEDTAAEHLADALAAAAEVFMPETLARNLGLIRSARQARGDTTPWLDTIIAALDRKTAEMSKPAST